MGQQFTKAQVTPVGSLPNDYAQALHCKHLPSSEAANADEESTLQGDVGNAGTLRAQAECGNLEEYRKLMLYDQSGKPRTLDEQRAAVLEGDVPYRYSSILYACYGDNRYKILQLVERELCALPPEAGAGAGLDTGWLSRMHSTRCWLGKNSAMVAAYQGHLDTMLYLVDLDLRGAFGDTDLFRERDVMGKTAMDWAASQGHTDTLEVLLIRSLYRLLPPCSPHPLVRRTRHRLVALLGLLSEHCADYQHPEVNRAFFQEVLQSIGYSAVREDGAAMAGWGGRVEWGCVEQLDGGLGGMGGMGWNAAGPGGGGGGGLSASGCEALQGPLCPGCGKQGGGGGGGWASPPALVRAEAELAAAAAAVGGKGAAAAESPRAQRAGGIGRGEKARRATGLAIKDVHITVSMLQDVVTAAHVAGLNAMGVVMFIQELLRQARYFEDLRQVCSSWEVGLLDTCRNKVEVQALLAPTEADPSEPVGFALATFDKPFLSHKFIQQVFTEKWDTMGVADFTHSPLGLAWSCVMLAGAFAGWAVVCPLAIMARSFLPPVDAFLQRGKVIVDSRFPWHVPLYRWLLCQCALLVFVGLLSAQVFTASAEATYGSVSGPVAVLLAVWCGAMLVDELQEYLEEGRAEYMSQGWNLLDVAMAGFYLCSFTLKLVAAARPRPGSALGPRDRVDMLLVANDCLAAAALMAWFRVVSVFELSSAIGPLIQMMKQMLLRDVTRFALLVVTLLMGFNVGMKALFQPVCVAGAAGQAEACTRYSQWGYRWQRDGIFGGLSFLQYVATGNYGDVTDFEQKRVTGILFYLVFAIVTSILMLNLFIAMLADTYTRVSTQAQVEFRYRKARIMASFSRREALCPPFNLLHLACGAAGNAAKRCARRCGLAGGHWTRAVALRKNDTAPLFGWYFPKGDALADVSALRHRVVAEWVRGVGAGLLKEAAAGELPALIKRLAAQGQLGQQRGGLQGQGQHAAAAATGGQG